MTMREIEVINQNLRYALAAFVPIGKGGLIQSGPQVNLVYAGVPYSLFNTAVFLPGSREQPDFPKALESALQFFRHWDAPWSMWFCEDLLDDAQRRRAKLLLATHGLRSMMEAPGMIASELAPPRRELPAILCRRVGDKRTRTHFSEIMALAFQVPIDMAAEVYAGEPLWRGQFHGWVGYHEDRPVTTACAIASPEATGLYAVATRPKEQRKGFAEALIRHAIAASWQERGEPSPLVLQSSESGYGLYARLGFRNITRYHVYVTH